MTSQETMYKLMVNVAKPFDGPAIKDAIAFRQDQYGLTQAQMAKVLGMERSHYNECVKGKREFPKTALRAAYIIGVPPDVIFQNGNSEIEE